MKTNEQTGNTMNQAKDTGLVAVLILLLIEYFTGSAKLGIVAIAVLVLVMTRPSLFRPLSVVWFGLSKIMGQIVSNLILTIIFYVIVSPVGFFRQKFGADAMKLHFWKNGSESVFTDHKKIYDRDDISKPY